MDYENMSDREILNRLNYCLRFDQPQPPELLEEANQRGVVLNMSKEKIAFEWAYLMDKQPVSGYDKDENYETIVTGTKRDGVIYIDGVVQVPVRVSKVKESD